MKMAVKMTTSLQQEKARVMMMSVTLRKNQARRKEGRVLQLGCEVFQECIEFDEEGQPVYFEKQKLLNKAHEAQKRLVEIDAIRREHQ